MNLFLPRKRHLVTAVPAVVYAVNYPIIIQVISEIQEKSCAFVEMVKIVCCHCFFTRFFLFQCFFHLLNSFPYTYLSILPPSPSTVCLFYYHFVVHVLNVEAHNICNQHCFLSELPQMVEHDHMLHRLPL